MKKLLIVCVAFAGLAFVGTTSTAQAGGVNFGITIGNGYGGYYGNPGYGYNQTPYYYGRRHSFWHNTSHYDYHPGGFQRHGNHYDYIPGHYDYHQTGHWDGGRRHHH